MRRTGSSRNRPRTLQSHDRRTLRQQLVELLTRIIDRAVHGVALAPKRSGYSWTCEGEA
jgi:hypothetical protein